jgi:alpha/beta superfamily hydrolase
VEWARVPAGPYLLEGELAYSEGADRPLGGVVLAGSHPLLGGNMHNNVVRGLGDGLAQCGWATLRFNYRGVGRSQGPALDVARHVAELWETSHVPGEMDLAQDVQAAADFLGGVVGPGWPLVLVGYSFGCALLPQVQLPQPPAALVLIAPPVGKHDYEAFTTVPTPLQVIVCDDDFAVEKACLRPWLDRLPAGASRVQASTGSHFFRGQEAWLVDTVSTFLQEHTR